MPGEEFVDLDLLSKLLQPKRTAPKSKIEVLESENLENGKWNGKWEVKCKLMLNSISNLVWLNV